MRIVAARRTDIEGVVVPFGRRLLPFPAPARRAWRHRPGKDRPSVGGAGRDPGAAEEAESGVIEIVAVEVVDIGAVGAGRHERIDLLAFEEDRHAVAGDLVAVVLADRALPGLVVVGLADPGGEHQQHVVEDVSSHDHDAGRLLELLAAAGIDIAHRPHLLGLLVVDELLHIGVSAQLEIRVRQQHGKNAGLRRRLCVGLAAEPLAVPAIFAGAERDALRVGVDRAHVRGRRRKRVIAQLLCGLLHQRGPHGLRERLVGIFVLPRPLEHVAAFDDLSAQVAGLAGNAAQLLEPVVVTARARRRRPDSPRSSSRRGRHCGHSGSAGGCAGCDRSAAAAR